MRTSGRKSKTRIIIAHLVDNWHFRRRFRAGNKDSYVGSTHLPFTTERSLDYIRGVFQDYLRFGSLSAGDLAGKTVLEIGPGDNLGVALLFLTAGAARVVCLDKFRSIRDSTKELAVYRMLRKSCTEEERQRFDQAIRLDGSASPNSERLDYIWGAGIEKAGPLLPRAGFDFVVSRAVLMEVHASDLAFEIMDSVMKPGGRMMHKISPVHDYGIFSRNGYHSLEYLTIPDSLYRLMTADSGKPNRKLMDYYRAKMNALGYDTTFYITAVVGQRAEFSSGTTALEYGRHYGEETLQLVRSIRPRLVERFRNLSDADLMTATVFLVAKKPCRPLSVAESAGVISFGSKNTAP